MLNLYDIAYWIGLALAAPYWLIAPSSRAKVLTALRARMARDLVRRESDGPAVLIHAVSVGEMNATRALVQQLRAGRPGLQFIISATTETGLARGKELYGADKDVTVVRYPLDFSAAIKRFLDAVRPNVVVLMELEAWPNFIWRCAQRNIPVVLANARLTSSSFRNYRLAGPLLRPMFRRIALVCAQDDPYCVKVLNLGVPHHHIVITGTMKFDNALAAPPSNIAAINRAAAAGLRLREELVWVCGSTGEGEEEIVLRVYRRMLARFARLRLVIVPRHPQRFDEVEQIIEANKFHCMRTSVPQPDYGDLAIPPVVLVDAMGVLRDFYSVATIVFVGRSLVDLGPRQHGSDMIEPAALGKPVIVGPHTGNFADAMQKFRNADAILEAGSEEALEQSVGVLLSTPKEAAAMGQRTAAVVKREQGATARHTRVILQILATQLGEQFEPRPASPLQSAPAPQPLPQPVPEPQIELPLTPPPREPEPSPPPPVRPPPPPPAPKKKPSVIITRIGPPPPSFTPDDNKIER